MKPWPLILVLLFAYSSLLKGQEATPLETNQPGDSIPFETIQPGDTIPASDSVQNIASFTELWESDTLNPGSDSILYYNQSPRVMGDTVHVEEDLSHSATRALMYSVVLPGLGQAYNKKYWKMPIVYVAIGASAYAIVFNSNQYKEASRLYIQDDSDYNRDVLDYWRYNMELSYIVAIAVYGLQVLDAYVDALLFNWNVNENLSMRVSPSIQPLHIPTSLTGQSVGLTASFTLKNRRQY